jgi:hypothetical protein
MNTKKMTTAITTGLYSVLLLLLVSGCDANNGMMYGNRATDMYHWNWLPAFIGLAVGFLIGFLVFRKKK